MKQEISSSKRTIAFSSRADGSFKVRVRQPESYAQTVVVIGGLLEHYAFLCDPVINEWAKAGYRAIAVNIPYERHLHDIEDVSELMHDVLVHTVADFKLETPRIVLHSGGSLTLAADDFQPDSYDQIILWSAAGIHRLRRHSWSSWYSLRRFSWNVLVSIFGSLRDPRLMVQVLVGTVAAIRISPHVPEILRIFYKHNIRDEVRKTDNLVVFHGQHDRIFPLDVDDRKWLQEAAIERHIFTRGVWNHAGMYSGRAVTQTKDIIKHLQHKA